MSAVRRGSTVLIALVLVIAGIGQANANEVNSRAEEPTPPATELTEPHPLALPNTAVYVLPAQGSGRKYEVWVDVPASYAGSDKRYPVVFVTDAGYSFPLIRSIRNRLGQNGRNIEDFILVGLSPEQGLTSKESRSRDYTPSNPLLDPVPNTKRYTATRYGEAAAYRDYIEQQVFPLIASRYRADMTRKIYTGHSYGGLFGSYVLLTKPEMFQTYILGSPSLWFNKHEMLTYEQNYASTHNDLAAKVMIYIGDHETPRYFDNEEDMVKDTRAFARKLKSRRYPSLIIDKKVLRDEDHLTIYPSLISRGLLWALPGSGPYNGG